MLIGISDKHFFVLYSINIFFTKIKKMAPRAGLEPAAIREHFSLGSR